MTSSLSFLPERSHISAGASKAWFSNHHHKLSPWTVILSPQTTLKLVCFHVCIRKSSWHRRVHSEKCISCSAKAVTTDIPENVRACSDSFHTNENYIFHSVLQLILIYVRTVSPAGHTCPCVAHCHTVS